MLPVNLLHTPFELMVFYIVPLIGLAVGIQAWKLGRLIARRMLQVPGRNTQPPDTSRWATVASPSRTVMVTSHSQSYEDMSRGLRRLTCRGNVAFLGSSWRKDNMSASDSTYPTEGMQRPPVDANSGSRKPFQGPDPGARERSTVIGTPGVSELHAAHLRDSAASMFMYASMGTVLAGLDVAGYRMFRDRLLVDYGNPTDPVEVMMLEQLALAHLNLGQLFGKASSANSVECASAYLAATTRLMGEFRRTALALPAYREAVQRLERGPELAASAQEKITSDSELQEVEHPDESSRGSRPQEHAGNARAIA
jgi:hypothetical protein